MKIKLVSDIHLECSDYTIPYSGEDILIIAGDVSPLFKRTFALINQYISRANPWVQVIFVAGNHDYYTRPLHETDAILETNQILKLIYLQNDSVVIEGLRFFGATMWTDVAENEEDVWTGIADFECIPDFTIDEFRRRHRDSREALRETLNNSSEPVVVITHHLPTIKSVDPKYADYPDGSSFAATDLEELVHHEKTILWCHGHTHTNHDYMDGKTRILCNPRGNVKMWKHHIKKRENPNFDDNFVFELSPVYSSL
jgi:predicted phosphohydrolase